MKGFFMKKFLILMLLLSTALLLHAKEPKYIFLFIGDGMATPQRMIAEEFSEKIGRGKLVMNHLPFHATTRTSSANALITDSDAAATAIACGEKTKNYSVGIDPDGKPLISSAAVARDNGKKVGILSSVQLNHATPAGFYGHRRNRSEYYNLGLDLVASGFDFFGGGGIIGYQTKDKKDIFTLAEEAGYTIALGKNGISALKPGVKAIAVACGKNNSMPYSIDKTPENLSLADVVAKAISLLDNKNGFFIMTEGGAIDWAGHANEAAANLHDVLALDDAVKVALEFYEKNPKETLIIVTGDHETGAMTMGFSGSGYNMNLQLLAKQKVSIGNFDSIYKKAKAEKKDFSFADAQKLVTEYFGFKFSGDKNDPLVLAEADVKKLETAFNTKNFAGTLRNLMNKKAGIGWNSGSHTALPVLTTSIGCGAENFTGFIENIEISRRLKKLLEK